MQKGVHCSGNNRGNTIESNTTKDIFICMPHHGLNGQKMIDCPKFIEMQKMFHGKSIIIVEVQPIVKILTIDVNVMDVNVTTRIGVQR